jgi:hypothetical protein
MVVDTEMVVDPADHAAVVMVEARMRNGRLGMMIADRVRPIDPEWAVRILGLPTGLIPDAATPDEILSRLGLARVGQAVMELGDAFLD